MTRLLASVTDAIEAGAAVAGGADIVDLKDPTTGALGALPLERISDLVRLVGGRVPVSATIGDLPADPALLADAVRRTAVTGVDYVKVGFLSDRNLEACAQAIAAATRNTALVAVLFADRAPPVDALSVLAAYGFSGVMLDTADKGRGHLLHHATLARLGHFVDQAGSLGLLSGLAGSLRLRDIASLLPLAPDYLGFRGALCRGSQRQQRLDPARLREVRRALRPAPPARGAARQPPPPARPGTR